jgi:hypothetical protein
MTLVEPVCLLMYPVLVTPYEKLRRFLLEAPLIFSEALIDK